jgi:hypothetical protein
VTSPLFTLALHGYGVDSTTIRARHASPEAAPFPGEETAMAKKSKKSKKDKKDKKGKKK